MMKKHAYLIQAYHKHVFKLQDLKYIMESDYIFARKFDGEDGELLRSIIRKYKWDEPLR